MATLMKIDGTTQEVHPKDAKRGFTLQELYTLIGGNCRLIEAPGPFADGRMMVMDEEGKLNGQQLNVEASEKFYKELGRKDLIMGNVVMVNDVEFQ